MGVEMIEKSAKGQIMATTTSSSTMENAMRRRCVHKFMTNSRLGCVVLHYSIVYFRKCGQRCACRPYSVCAERAICDVPGKK